MIVCIIQARTGSTRLPGKVLMKLDEKNTVLDYVINQLSFSKLIDKMIIATTNLEQDDVIEDIANRLKTQCFRGDSDDVLDRYYQCAIKFEADNILRITSDCPLIDPEIVDKVITMYLTKDYDYVSNTLIKTFPVGTDVEVFSFEVLKSTWNNAKLPSEREHVTPYIRNKKLNCRLGNFLNDKKQENYRWTLDRKEDLILIEKIVQNINKRPILIKDIMELFSKNQNLININSHIPKNEGMIKSLEKDEIEKRKKHEEN